MGLGLAQNRRMNSYPDPRPDAEPELAPVIYEQPLNERMRTFLRLEFLYTRPLITQTFLTPGAPERRSLASSKSLRLQREETRAARFLRSWSGMSTSLRNFRPKRAWTLA